MNPTLPKENPLLDWEAPQHEHHTHTKRWYAGATLFVLLCLAYAFWMDAWTFMVVIVLMSVVYTIAHRKTETNVRMRIWEKGYALNNEFVDWKDCIGYWMLQTPTNTTLTIAHKKSFTPYAKILLASQDPQEIHGVMDRFLPVMQSRKENLIDTIIHICKL